MEWMRSVPVGEARIALAYLCKSIGPRRGKSFSIHKAQTAGEVSNVCWAFSGVEGEFFTCQFANRRLRVCCSLKADGLSSICITTRRQGTPCKSGTVAPL